MEVVPIDGPIRQRPTRVAGGELAWRCALKLGFMGMHTRWQPRFNPPALSADAARLAHAHRGAVSAASNLALASVFQL